MKNTVYMVSMIIVLCLLVGCIGGGNKTNTLTVEVYEEGSTELYRGEVVLELDGKTAIIKESGIYKFTKLSSGTKTLNVQAAGFITSAEEVQVGNGKDNKHSVILVPADITAQLLFENDSYLYGQVLGSIELQSYLPQVKALIAQQTFTGNAGFGDGSKLTVAKAQALVEHFVYNVASYVKRPNSLYPNWSYSASDNKYKNVPIPGSLGCMHYANFIAAVMHKGTANILGRGPQLTHSEAIGRFTPAGVRNFLQTNAQAGEHMRLYDVHSLIYLASDNSYIYTLEWYGNHTQPLFLRWTWAEFTDYLNGKNVRFFIYNASTGKNTGGAVINPPATPTGLRAVKYNEDRVTVSWNAVPGATHYEVQYKHNGVDWTKSGGYTNSTATSYIALVSNHDKYQFRVRAVNSAGASSWASTVYEKEPAPTPPVKPTITKQLGDIAVIEGDDVIFEVKASVPDGGSLEYRFQLSRDNGINWETTEWIPNESTLVIDNVSGRLNGTLYRYQIRNHKNGVYSEVVTSSVSKLTVLYEPMILESPRDLRLSLGDTGSFVIEDVLVPSGKLEYQWQVSTDNGNSWSNIPGGISKVYTTPAMTWDMDGNLYRCLTRNTHGGLSTPWIYSEYAQLLLDYEELVDPDEPDYPDVEIVFVNPNPFSTVNINSGSLITVEFLGDISDLSVVALLLFDVDLGAEEPEVIWATLHEPVPVVQTLIPENLETGSYALAAVLSDEQGPIINDSILFNWVNERDGFGGGRFDFGDN